MVCARYGLFAGHSKREQVNGQAMCADGSLAPIPVLLTIVRDLVPGAAGGVAQGLVLPDAALGAEEPGRR